MSVYLKIDPQMPNGEIAEALVGPFWPWLSACPLGKAFLAVAPTTRGERVPVEPVVDEDSAGGLEYILPREVCRR